mmetsp:Transcript_5790/g.11931  ORF Transcript_5790/g.11931 Transcript_5790/m.11931 type:complete len:135 (-) Transcript_5790:493-897(-)
MREINYLRIAYCRCVMKERHCTPFSSSSFMLREWNATEKSPLSANLSVPNSRCIRILLAPIVSQRTNETHILTPVTSWVFCFTNLLFFLTDELDNSAELVFDTPLSAALDVTGQKLIEKFSVGLHSAGITTPIT